MRDREGEAKNRNCRVKFCLIFISVMDINALETAAFSAGSSDLAASECRVYECEIEDIALWANFIAYIEYMITSIVLINVNELRIHPTGDGFTSFFFNWYFQYTDIFLFNKAIRFTVTYRDNQHIICFDEAIQHDFFLRKNRLDPCLSYNWLYCIENNEPIET